MEQLFPNEMIIDSVKNQEELDAAFLRYPTFAKGFVQIALCRGDTRKWYEKEWPQVYKYLDDNFVNCFRSEAQHSARAWEFYLVSVLLRKGFKLCEKTWEYGPDICILLQNSKKLWIEAISCNRGDKEPVEPLPEMVSGKIYSFGGNIEDMHRPRALRITSAVVTKLKQFESYINTPKQSGVQTIDYLVIAVNGADIQHLDDPRMLFKYAIVGQGPDILLRRPGEKKFASGFYKPIDAISRNSGDAIPANFLEMPEFSKISAVLYSGHRISSSWLNGWEPGDDFLFGYHSFADNPIPKGTFKFGRGIRKFKDGSVSDELQT